MTSYQRFPFFARGEDSVEITEREYENAEKAGAGIFPALFIEEQFDAILRTYIEFETTLYAIGLRSMVHFHFGWKETIEENLRVNSRVIEHLTNCRMYLDHVPHRLGLIFGKPHASIDEFNDARRKEHTDHLAYRFCDALRNFTQHTDLPVDGLYIDSHWADDRSKCEHRIAAYTSMSDLEKSKISKKVIDELKATFDETIDIKRMLRQYVTSLGRIHEVVRKRLDTEVDRWEQWIADVVDKSKHGSHPELAKVGADGEVLETVRVSKDWPERLRMLLRKNMNVTHYDLHYISGEPFAPKEDS